MEKNETKTFKHIITKTVTRSKREKVKQQRFNKNFK